MIASVISFIIKIGTSKRVAWYQYIQSNWLSIHRRLYYLMKQLISVPELKEYDDNIKTKTGKPFWLRTSKHMPKKYRYHSTDTLHTQKYHSQPTLNPYNPPSLKVHAYSHSYHLHHQHYLFVSYTVLVFFWVASFIPQPYPSSTPPTFVTDANLISVLISVGTLRSTPLWFEYLVAQPEEVSDPWSMAWEKGGRATNPICHCSRHRYWQR